MKYIYEKKWIWFHYLVLLSLLANLVIMSVDLTTLNSLYSDLTSLGQVVIAYDVIIIILSAIALIGLLNWHKAGWYSIILVKALGIIFIFCIPSDQLTTNYYYKIIFSVIVIIYYFRRKPLFFPDMSKEKNSTTTEI